MPAYASLQSETVDGETTETSFEQNGFPQRRYPLTLLAYSLSIWGLCGTFNESCHSYSAKCSALSRTSASCAATLECCAVRILDFRRHHRVAICTGLFLLRGRQQVPKHGTVFACADCEVSVMHLASIYTHIYIRWQMYSEGGGRCQHQSVSG